MTQTGESVNRLYSQKKLKLLSYLLPVVFPTVKFQNGECNALMICKAIKGHVS